MSDSPERAKFELHDLPVDEVELTPEEAENAQGGILIGLLQPANQLPAVQKPASTDLQNTQLFGDGSVRY
jgi:hypothetical protein